MIARRLSTSNSETMTLNPTSSESQINTREERRLKRRDNSHYERGKSGFSSIVVVMLGVLGCVSLVTQVAFIIYVSSMTFSRLESVFYAPHKKLNNTSSKSEAKPRIMGYYFQNISSSSHLGSERLDPNMHRRLTRNVVEMSKNEFLRQRHLQDSEDYIAEQTDPLEDGDCVAQYDWQKMSFPTCNLLHELDMNSRSSIEEHVRILSLGGFWRDIWLVNSSAQNEQVVLKTLRLRHKFSERNFDRHRRDALAMERLTSSQNVIQMFGYCGNSGITEFADGGSLEDVVYKPPDSPGSWNMSEKIIVAYQIATALSDVHNLDTVGRASIAHTDITPANFVYMKNKGRYVLNDFNRCRLIAWNKKLDQACSFQVGNNPGTFRAPEEYAYDDETEKVDVYSLGNIYYSLLTSDWPFDREKEEIAQKKILRGTRPPLDETLLTSQDPYTQALLQTIDLCWKQDPKERATAAEVESFLSLQLLRLGMAQIPSGVGDGKS